MIFRMTSGLLRSRDPNVVKTALGKYSWRLVLSRKPRLTASSSGS